MAESFSDQSLSGDVFSSVTQINLMEESSCFAQIQSMEHTGERGTGRGEVTSEVRCSILEEEEHKVGEGNPIGALADIDEAYLSPEEKKFLRTAIEAAFKDEDYLIPEKKLLITAIEAAFKDEDYLSPEEKIFLRIVKKALKDKDYHSPEEKKLLRTAKEALIEFLRTSKPISRPKEHYGEGNPIGALTDIDEAYLSPEEKKFLRTAIEAAFKDEDYLIPEKKLMITAIEAAFKDEDYLSPEEKIFLRIVKETLKDKDYHSPEEKKLLRTAKEALIEFLRTSKPISRPKNK